MFSVRVSIRVRVRVSARFIVRFRHFQVQRSADPHVRTSAFYPWPTLDVGHTKRRNDGTARSVIRPMGGRRAGVITAGTVPSSVPSCLQQTKTLAL